jgi:hypothetical protein
LTGEATNRIFRLAPQETGVEGVIMTASKVTANEPAPICPYWHQVAADFASMYPGAGYCLAGSQLRIKVLAERTMRDLCARNFAECEGYHRLLAQEEAKQRQALGTLWH